jgi:hypothetical protein
VAIRVEFVKGDFHACAGIGAGIKRGDDATISVKVYFAGTFDALDHDFGVPFTGTGAGPLVDWYPAVVRSRSGVGVSNAVEGCIEYAVPMGVRVVFVKGGCMVILGSATGSGSRSGLGRQSWSSARARQSLKMPRSGAVSQSGLWLVSWAKSKARASGWSTACCGSAAYARIGSRLKSQSLSRSTVGVRF